MSINQNDITLILGKKGTGKTTLVLHHLLNSLLPAIDTLLIISNDKESYHHITNNVFSTKQLGFILNFIKNKLPIFQPLNKKLIIIDELDSGNIVLEDFLKICKDYNYGVLLISQLENTNMLIRNKIDNVIFAKETNNLCIKRYYDRYFKDCEKSQEFKNTITNLNNNEFISVKNNNIIILKAEIGDLNYKFELRPGDIQYLLQEEIVKMDDIKLLTEKINIMNNEIMNLKARLNKLERE
jgi:hypothetical protein